MAVLGAEVKEVNCCLPTTAEGTHRIQSSLGLEKIVVEGRVPCRKLVDQRRGGRYPFLAILLTEVLLGGLLRELYPDSSTAVGEKVELYVETAYDSQDLTHWVNGYGHIPHFYPKSGEHGYVAISAYLQEVVPQIETRLYKEAERLINASEQHWNPNDKAK
ncbi:hypothetical protein VP01_348g4 [Puccinia sorghi]|uniref:Uncharacterized protein n=1 Tax=Puccinia sorghi TaxID=27349 RepID=A0A0L6UWM4_9BASI|nr:hypothetical protein VP01_348g4 [Puccinia sorghi]